MRVAMLTYSTKPRGGVVHTTYLAEHLQALGIEVQIFALAPANSITDFYRKVSVPYEIIPYHKKEKLVQNVAEMIRAYTTNLPRGFDIYHAQDCVAGSALYKLKKVRAMRTVRTVHHIDDFTEPYLLKCQLRSILGCDWRIVVSRYWQRELKKRFGTNSTVIYNGIDTARFRPLAREHKKVGEGSERKILFVGGLERRKGLEFLLLAMEQVLAVHNVKLTVIGREGFTDKTSFGWFETLVRRLRLERKVKFVSYVPDEKMPSFYQACDLFVLPSRCEGWGLVLMEAMACGKPVVATRVGGIPELVKSGWNGYLVEPCDVHALAETISKLLARPRLCAMLGQNGLRTVSRYTWMRAAKRTKRLYEKIEQ